MKSTIYDFVKMRAVPPQNRKQLGDGRVATLKIGKRCLVDMRQWLAPNGRDDA